jgi:hypothetical protein
MESFFIYLLKANVSLGLFYSFYLLFLRRETFYKCSRFYLLGALVLSYVLPWLGSLSWIHEQSTFQAGLSQLSESEIIAWLMHQMDKPQTLLPSLGSVFGWILFGGAIFLCGQLLLELFVLLRLRKESTADCIDRVPIRRMKRHLAPFSFFRDIFLNPELHTPEATLRILFHEKAHVRQHHTLDVLISRITIITGWFNPFAWMIRKSILQNLEYLADRDALSKGFAKKEYQYHLISVSIFSQPIPLTSQYNQHFLKNRIKMMNKKESPRLRLAKYFFILPLIFASLIMTNANELRKETLKHMPEVIQQTTATLQKTISEPIEITVLHKVSSEKDILTDKSENRNHQKTEIGKDIQIPADSLIVQPVGDVNPDLRPEGADPHSMDDIKVIGYGKKPQIVNIVLSPLPDSFSGFDDAEIAQLNEQMKQLGEQMNEQLKNETDQNKYQSIVNAYVQKITELGAQIGAKSAEWGNLVSQSAVKSAVDGNSYGKSLQGPDKAEQDKANKEMQRLNKKMDKLREQMSTIDKNVQVITPKIRITGKASGINLTSENSSFLTSENSPLVILDGVVLNPDLKVSQEAIDQYKNLNPEAIQSIEVKQDTKLLEQYPHVRAKNGVIEILTKK